MRAGAAVCLAAAGTLAGGALWATSASAVPAVPGAPTSLAAQPVNGAVSLTWVAPTSDGGSPILGYNVYLGFSSGGESATPINGATVTGLTYVVGGLTNGITYWFTVKAVNVNGSSIASNEASAAPALVPGAPTGLSQVSSNASVALTWSAPSSSGGSAILGYDVYQGSASGSESATPVNGSLVTGLTYTVSGLTNGDTYYFTVKAVNTQGASLPSNEAIGNPVPTAPGAPTGLVATTGNALASLSWVAPANTGGSAILGYNIYQGTSSGGENYTTPINGSSLVAGPTATVTGLTNGTTYYFTVKAVNAIGSSVASNEGLTAPGAAVPGAPTGLAATPGNGSAALTWTAPASTGGATILGYDVYQGTTTGGENYTTPVNGTTLVTTTSYTATGLTNGVTYYFTVKAVNAVGGSAASNEATSSAPITVPGAPTTLVAVVGVSSATLTWVAPANNGGATVLGYDVYQGTSPGGEDYGTPVNGATLITGTTTTITALASGFTYYFTVAAVNVHGASQPSNEASASFAVAPGAPTGLAASPGSGSVTLSWTAPASNGGSAILGYDAFQGTSPGGESATPINGGIPITGTSVTVSGLTTGTTYFFTVKALNSVGPSAASNEASGSPATVPGAPTGLSATVGDQSASLSWTAPSSDGGASILGYNVYAGMSSGGESQIPVNGALVSGTSYQVNGLSNGVTYYFVVKAVNVVGASQPSNEASTTAGTVPSHPVLLPVTVGNGSVTLTWVAPSSTGGSAILGYDVYVGSTSGAESGTPDNPSPVPDTTYAVQGLTNGTTYYFTVEAVNALGNSAPSNEMSGTPVTVPGAPSGLTAKAGNGSAALSWSAPSSTGGTALLGYDVFRGTTPGGETGTPLNASPITATAYTAAGLTNGTTYYFTVTAVNAQGSSAASNEASSAPAKGASSTSLTLSKTVIHYAAQQTVTFIVKVTGVGAGPAVTGTVKIKIGAKAYCSAVLSAGSGRCVLPAKALKVGTYTVVAAYGGTSSYGASNSAGKKLTITA